MFTTLHRVVIAAAGQEISFAFLLANYLVAMWVVVVGRLGSHLRIDPTTYWVLNKNFDVLQIVLLDFFKINFYQITIQILITFLQVNPVLVILFIIATIQWARHRSGIVATNQHRPYKLLRRLRNWAKSWGVSHIALQLMWRLTYSMSMWV